MFHSWYKKELIFLCLSATILFLFLFSGFNGFSSFLRGAIKGVERGWIR